MHDYPLGFSRKNHLRQHFEAQNHLNLFSLIHFKEENINKKENHNLSTCIKVN